MPVYNAGAYLVKSIQSILNQTYTNFEFIIVDDASIDNSRKILERFARKDKRITLMRNLKNMGVSITVKKAIAKAKGSYLARMDADDIARSDRLEKQVNYLMSHPRTVALGGQCDVIDAKGNNIGRKEFPTAFEDIYRYIFTLIPLQQPTLMISRKLLPKNFRYYVDGMNTAEEVELIFKLFQYGKVENLPDTLLKYRIHGANTSLVNLKQTFLLTLISRLQAVIKYGYVPTVGGVISTIAETIAVLILPQLVTLWLYTKIKKIASKAASIPSFRLAPRYASGVS